MKITVHFSEGSDAVFENGKWICAEEGDRLICERVTRPERARLSIRNTIASVVRMAGRMGAPVKIELTPDDCAFFLTSPPLAPGSMEDSIR